MKRYFGEYYHTKIAAKIALASWRKKFKEDVKSRKDVIASDKSYVYKTFAWVKSDEFTSKQTKIKKWFIRRIIWTEKMFHDVNRYRGIDAYEEFKNLVNDYKKIDKLN